jgi:hypothetical protein
MRELGGVTAVTVVDAFVRAEIDSPRFKDGYRYYLAARGGTLATVLEPDRSELRTQLLGDVRGYGRNTLLFRGFPAEVSWRLVELETPRDWKNIRYANEREWITLSGGSRLVADGAARVDLVRKDETIHIIKDNVQAILRDVSEGTTYPDLIAVESTHAPGELVLAEGHTRATAYVRAGIAEGVRVIIGTSATMASWHYF